MLGLASTGLIAKIAQYNHPHRPSPHSYDSISHKGLDLVGPVFAGSMANIYRGKLNSIDVAVKQIKTDAPAKVARDCTTLMGFSVAAQWMNGSAARLLRDVAHAASRELDLERELDMALLIHCHAQKYGASTPKYILELCDSDSLVYEYVSGSSLNELKAHQISETVGIRIVETFFGLLHEHGILLVDVNPGNFVYDQTTDKLTLVDFGAVEVLADDIRTVLKGIHNSKGEENLIRSVCGDDCLAGVLKRQSEYFWSSQPVLPDFRLADLDPNIINSQIPPDFAGICRAGMQLMALLQFLGRPLALRGVMEKFVSK